jgi:hypothetical protein
MTETPGAAFNRVRVELGDKWEYIGALVGITGGGARNSVYYRSVPNRWLPLLPAEYVLPVCAAMIEKHLAAIHEIEAIVSEKVRPRQGEHNRGLGELPVSMED